MQADAAALPAALADAARLAWENIMERAPAPLVEQLLAAATGGPVAKQLPRVLACSPFVAELGRREPSLLLDMISGTELLEPLDEAVFNRGLQQQLGAEGVEPGVVLRRFRQRHMLRIIWRDFCRLADTQETVRDTSLLAETCIAEALAISQAALEERFGVPVIATGRASN